MALFVQPAGFKIVDSRGGLTGLLWSEIEEIHAFKKDLVTMDLICLAFMRSGTQTFYEINEEMAGYRNLLEVMQKNLPGFNLDWMLDTTFRAFATNHQVIWKRFALAVSS